MLLFLPDDLKVGIRELDEQHEALYAAVNRLHEAMRAHELGHAVEVLDYLARYSAEHFSTEERLMIDTGYGGFPDHLARHDQFKKDLARWRARLTKEGPSAPLVVELSGWITAWLRDHIRRSDAAMAKHLRAHAAKG